MAGKAKWETVVPNDAAPIEEETLRTIMGDSCPPSIWELGKLTARMWHDCMRAGDMKGACACIYQLRVLSKDQAKSGRKVADRDDLDELAGL